MRSTSTGIRAALRLLRKATRKRAGFTLIEALVALALVLSFAAVLGPYMFHARRIVSGVDDRIAAQILLRSLVDAPFERSTAPNPMREGSTAGLQWRITEEPMFVESMQPALERMSSRQEQNEPAAEQPSWKAFRVIASVSWGPGSSISAETLRLGRVERP
jgi:prepilin-type N-terminal cleavage/methylation domain-containing protein